MTIRDYPMVLRFEAVLSRMERRGIRRSGEKWMAAHARLVGAAYGVPETVTS